MDLILSAKHEGLHALPSVSTVRERNQLQRQITSAASITQQKYSGGQDSGTYYGTCYQSSNEKYGRTTLSFHTANSQLIKSDEKTHEVAADIKLQQV